MPYQPNNEDHTLTDVLTRRGADGKLLDVAEVLEKETVIFPSAYHVEANNVTKHDYSRRLTKPKSTARILGEAKKFSKGATVNLSASFGIFSNAMKITEDEYKINEGRINDYMNTEAKSYISEMGDQAEESLIYSSIANGDAFDGLAAMTNDLNQENVFDAGGSAATRTSIYLVAWGPKATYCIHPKGSSAGIERDMLGWQVITENNLAGDAGVNKYFMETFDLKLGLVTEDPRSIARIANIDTTAAFDEDVFIKALGLMPAKFARKAVGYCSKITQVNIDIRSNDKVNVAYPAENVFGRHTTIIRGTPIMKSEFVSDFEEAVVAV